MGELHRQVEAVADDIEAEMKRIGWWDIPEPSAPSDAAFGMDVMAFPQWIRFVLIPRIREIVATDGELPVSSSVGAQAVREFDGDERAEHLTHLLSRLDGVISRGEDE